MILKAWENGVLLSSSAAIPETMTLYQFTGPAKPFVRAFSRNLLESCRTMNVGSNLSAITTHLFGEVRSNLRLLICKKPCLQGSSRSHICDPYAGIRREDNAQGRIQLSK